MSQIQQSNNNLLNSSEQLISDFDMTVKLYNELIQKQSNNEKYKEEFNTILKETSTLITSLSLITEKYVDLSKNINQKT